jgi:hypothetical protein
LKTHPSAVDEAGQIFLNSETQTSIGKLYAVKNTIANANIEKTGFLNTIRNFNQQILDKKSELEQIENLLSEQLTDVALKMQRSLKLAEIKTVEQQLEQTSANMKNAWNTALNTALSLNNSVLALEIYEQNEKNVNQIWLNSVAKDVEINATQQAQLYNVANQCPYSGGEAVFIARAIYQNSNENTSFDDVQLCATAGARAMPNKAETLAEIVVFPNPADAVLQILNPKNANYDTFEIVNTLGQVITQATLTNNTIDVSSYQEGIYVCKMLKDNKVLSTIKFVIQH